MNVNLVSVTKAFTIEGKDLTPEELIVYIARVSNPANQMNTETSAKLIAYLIKNKHWSPLEMVDMTVEIVTSRGIAQQILRHRSFSFQEFSQRYAEVTDFEPVLIRKQAEKNRQSSTDDFDPTLTGDDDQASKVIADYIKQGEELYKKLLSAGVAKECARMILPITTQTRIYMKGSIRSWVHYLQQRTAPSTQMEHRQVALCIETFFNDNFPNIAKALNDGGQ